MTSTATAANTTPKATETPKLGPEWNRLAASMQRFHDQWEWEFNTIYANADKAKQMGMNRFLQEASLVSRHLDGHHRIEEAHIFPNLAHKLPQFAANNSDHVAAHRGIHAGLERYNAYLDSVRRAPETYNPADLRAVMDSFREVLFHHLDQEVKDLGAESVYKAGFTLQELRRVGL